MVLIQALPPLLTHKYVPSAIPSGKSGAVTGQFFGFRVRSGALLGAVAYIDGKYETPLALWNGRVFTHRFSSIQFQAMADPFSLGVVPTKAGPLVIDLLQTNDLQLLGPPEVWSEPSGATAPLPLAPDTDSVIVYNRTGLVVAAATDTTLFELSLVPTTRFHGTETDKLVGWATPATKLVGGFEGTAAFTVRKWAGFWDGSAVQWSEIFNRVSAANVTATAQINSLDGVDITFPFMKFSVYSAAGTTLRGCIAARNKT